jgi:hypothetical protein
MENVPNSPWPDRDELKVVRTFRDAGVRFVIADGRAIQFIVTNISFWRFFNS